MTKSEYLTEYDAIVKTARASDVFTLLKWNGEWKITHKLFHWHDQ
jgi:hypothetical protein